MWSASRAWSTASTLRARRPTAGGARLRRRRMAVSDPRQQAPLPAPTDPVQQDDLLPREVVRIVNEYVREAEEARTERMALNRRNREMYLGIQDFSHKIEGQSTESIPKLAEAAEQFAAFVKRGLTSLGDWFTVELPDGLPLNGEQAA